MSHFPGNVVANSWYADFLDFTAETTGSVFGGYGSDFGKVKWGQATFNNASYAHPCQRRSMISP